MMRCKLGAIGAMLCVSGGYVVTQKNAGALVSEVLRDARSSTDPRLNCMGRKLAKHLHSWRAHIRPKAGVNNASFYPQGEQRFDIICRRKDLHGHLPFGVRVFGPGKIAAESCAVEIESMQE